MGKNLEELRRKYPLHVAVYLDDVKSLEELIDTDKDMSLDGVDCRGRTPLMLAVTLGHTQCALLLLRKGADADAQNKEMWCVSHEAICRGEPELVRQVIKHRDYQRGHKAVTSMRNHLQTLAATPDFYAEMGWEFSSWVPFVSKMCPSDTYKIYKRGSCVRIDTTLAGFEGSSWRRANQTFVFQLDGDQPMLILIDHNAKTASVQTMCYDDPMEDYDPPEEAVHFRLTSPVSTTYIDVDKIGFERSRPGGLFGWISSGERTEKIDSHECKVFNATCVDLVTKTRSEHLSEEDKERIKQEESAHPLSSVLNMVRAEDRRDEATVVEEPAVDDYLDPTYTLNGDIGLPQQVTRKANSFKATLWLAEQYPLALQEQVVPIVDLMAANSAHFARLHNFIRLQLPAGFPVKIEIPLFHVVSARITFGRINEPAPRVTPTDEGGVSIDPVVFAVPAGYRTLDSSDASWWNRDEQPSATHHNTHHNPQFGASSADQTEEMLLQLAIQESLRGEDLEDSSPEDEMQRAIAASLSLTGSAPPPLDTPTDDLSTALRLSQAESRRMEEEQREQEEELQRVLALSLTDK